MEKHSYGIAFSWYVGIVSLFLVYVGVDAMRQHDRWATGDWLINYTGGFVRRGLSGQIALYLSHSGPISLYAWVFIFQLMCYTLMFGTIVLLLRNMTWTIWMLAILYSPATLSFTLLEPTFAFRKEILFLAFLSVLILALDARITSDIAVSIMVAISMVGIVLCHEPMLLYYPYVVCALIVAKERVSKALLIAAPGATAGFVAFVASVRHPGNLRTAIAICNSLGEHELAAEPCSGAIVYMSRGAAMARQDVLTAIDYWHLKVVMPFLLVMSLGPIMLGMTALWRRQQERRLVSALVTCSCLAWSATVPLFIFGFDWNRWIYVHVFSSLLLMLFLERRWQKGTLLERGKSLLRENEGVGELVGEALAVQQPLFTRNGRRRIVCIVMLLISSCGWQLGVYHHFPLPGDTLMVYLRKRSKGQPLHNKLDWRPPGS